jgi:hypothetical protein
MIWHRPELNCLRELIIDVLLQGPGRMAQFNGQASADQGKTPKFFSQGGSGFAARFVISSAVP